MGGKLPVVSGKRVLQVLQRAGFVVERIVGSHHVLVYPDDASRTVTVPVHGNRDLKPGTLRSIIRQAGFTVDEFLICCKSDQCRANGGAAGGRAWELRRWRGRFGEEASKDSGDVMKWIGAAALSALLLGPAAAQETKLTIEPGHTAVLHQYVASARVQPAVMKLHFELGTAVPDSIKTTPVPLGMVAKVPEVRNYEYFVADGGKVVFVEPYTRRIVQIVP